MLQVVDNFFTKKIHEEVKTFCKQGLTFAPSFTKGKNYYGLRSSLYKTDLTKCFTDTAKHKLKINITKVHRESGIDIRDLENFIPHTDPHSSLNLFVMIQGDKAANNGIVFYDKKEIDMHIGFKENRAVLFSSDIIHSPNIYPKKNIKRITSTLFITEYDFIID
tara:strand:+ start:196 stop:687 length:492 start_codon:yes stop_codon:yes gene_type:complete